MADLKEENQQEDHWRSRLGNLIYHTWYPEETDLKEQVQQAVLDNEELMGEVDTYHGEHVRCAFVMLLHFDREGCIDDVDGFLADEVTVMSLISLDEVKTHLAHYDPDSEICVILVRNSEAVGFILPRSM